jgi:Tfp pilus assembly protein PilN
MLRINLYPGPPRKGLFPGWDLFKFDVRYPLRNRATLIFYTLIGLFIALSVLSYFVKRHTIAQLQGEIQTAVADSIKYSESIRLINDIKERENGIQERIEVIRRVDQNRYLWSKLMAGINDALPSATWLTRIETISPFPNLDFKIEGVSFSNIEIANFMRRLEKLYNINQVRLLTSRESTIEGMSTMAFTIECSSNRSPQPEMNAVGGKGGNIKKR